MTSRPDYFAEAQVPDMERRLASMLRLGTVSATDYSDPKKPRVRVTAGKVTTGWIPWSAARAGRARVWSPLKVGEQVLVAAPSGDLAQAVVVGSIFYNDREAPATAADQTVTAWDDGARESYDEASHTRHLEVPSGGTVVIKVGATTWTLTDGGATLETTNMTIKGRVKVEGQITASQDIIAGRSPDADSGGISLLHHHHSGVQRGGSVTDEPT